MQPASTRRIQPIVALRAFRKLVRNPQDTHQVFMIGEALRGHSLARATQRFRATAIGRETLAGRDRLMPLLAERAALGALPPGSLGRAYLDFVVSENLSAQGLAEAARQRDEMSAATADEQAFRRRLRDSHDLWHVLTGYGRDPLGEVCLLAFTYAQTRQNGIGVIALLGAFRIGRALRGLPVRAAVLEAYRAGRDAAWLPAEDWGPRMPQDLSRARESLKVTVASQYLRIIGQVNRERAGVRPADALT